MKQSSPDMLFQQMTSVLDDSHPTDWQDIADLLDYFKNLENVPLAPDAAGFLNAVATGTAFITFGYSIDGVSVEIAKYARIMKDICRSQGNCSIHLIGGDFQRKASSIIDSDWTRFEMDGIDGWDKWEGGKWFKALFMQNMKSHSPESKKLAEEIFRQAVVIAKELGRYFVDHQISLLIPVNIASNPGNFSLTLGTALVTEALGIYVINSNHDFYWEAGKPYWKRGPNERPGIRDHFFLNARNKSFFSLLKMLFPWNGKRWLQVNINMRQSRILVEMYDLPKEKITEMSTSITEEFLEDYTEKDKKYARLRIAHILSDGEPILRPVPIADHLAKIDAWMTDQQPIILGACPGLSVDPLSDHLSYLLQPTRIISRKRIERDLDLIEALLLNSPLRDEFENNPQRELILHITGPAPVEHQQDLERVLYAYQRVIENLPELIAQRVFVAFSVGHHDHPSFSTKNLEPLTIESLYHIADLLLFPSKTEGRGLPIIEASATGIPIICSRYRPKEVFDSVIGTGLSDELRILYTLFPEGDFNPRFLAEVSNLLLHPEANQTRIRHNQQAVRARYSHQALKKKFELLLNQVYRLG
jgi:glycosyltransferase involved in cell wall biosynthesis